MKRQWIAGVLLACAISMGTGMLHTQVQAETIQEEAGAETQQENTGPEGAEDGEYAPDDNMNQDGVEKPEEPEQPEEPEKPEEPEQPEESVNQYEIDQLAWKKAALKNTYIRCAKTVKRQLIINHTPEESSKYRITWKSSSKKIATVDTKGKVTAVGTGKATITCTITTESGYQKKLYCEIQVTNPKFKKSTYAVAKGTKLLLTVSGTDTKKIELTSKNTAIVKTYKKDPGIVRGMAEGKTKVRATVDGKVIECTIRVSNPKIKKNLFVMTAKKSDTIKIYNTSGLEKVKYTSSKPSVATVSSTGKIKTLKVGVSVIKATVDNKCFEITVSVGKKAAVDAIKNAQKALGYKYSQPRRMWKYYRDCSSLVWRSYAPTGYLFGYKKNASNAPTAAEECYYLVKHKREVAKSYVSESKMRPGDLIFISSGYNGRFRNIGHVAIYIGNDIIIHATPRNSNGVQYGTVSYYKDKIVSIGRPVK